MFRRRPIRRMLRSERGRVRRAPRELILANQLMESGDYQGAAEQFEALARLAASRNGRHTPQFYLQAGRARILAGQNEAGMTNLKQGMSLLAGRLAWRRFYNAGNRIVSELNQLGLKNEANEILDSLNAKLPGNFSAPVSANATRKPVLPAHCPSCGGAIRPDEVEWLDEVTAECAYCGSPLREGD
jgi:hypothetical protein